MEKEKVMTVVGALKHLGISNMTFYVNYRPFLKPKGKIGKALLYSVADLDQRKKDIESDRFFHAKFEVVQ